MLLPLPPHSNGIINTHHHNWIILIIFNVNSRRLNLDPPPPQLVLLRTLLSFSTVIFSLIAAACLTSKPATEWNSLYFFALSCCEDAPKLQCGYEVLPFLPPREAGWSPPSWSQDLMGHSVYYKRTREEEVEGRKYLWAKRDFIRARKDTGVQRRGRKEIQGSPQQQLALSLEGCLLSEQISLNGAGRRDQKQECYTSTLLNWVTHWRGDQATIWLSELWWKGLTVADHCHTHPHSWFFEAKCQVAQGGIQFFG